METKKTILCVLLTLFITSICGTVEAKSVFIISRQDAPDPMADAYLINGNGVNLQGTVDIDTYNPGIGPVRLFDDCLVVYDNTDKSWRN
jgi:hypothetical protein